MRARSLLLGLLTLAMPASAQDDGVEPAKRAPVPFVLGERAEYNVKFGFIPAGSGTMEVIAIDTIRGIEAWHTLFRVRGGVPGFRVLDRFESWMDTHTLASLRHRQELSEGSKERERQFEIYPDRGVYVEDAKEPVPTVALPLDDGSFLYFLRTVPLEVGREYSFDRYFRPDRNPVRIQVLRRERVHVPAGTFDCVVIRPIIKSRGVFAENGRAEVWLTDDTNRLMVQMKTHLKFGSLNLYLKSYTRPQPDSSSLARQ